jgi:tripartite-type tricarboxylate transporter receptor subunit TctC
MIRLFLAAFAVLIATASAAADNYPTRPIRVLTSSSAGGLSDMFMRGLGEEFQKATGQPIIIENRPGGMGNIASRACTEAAPDGYTICILNTDNAAYNQHLFKNLPYDPDKLVPIVNLFHLIQVLVVNADLKVKTVDELVALSKAKPGTMNYLTASLPLVVFMESLKRDKGADWVRVPFRGGGEAANAIMSGTTPIGLLGLGNVLSQIEGGKMTALVLTNNLRTPQLPNTLHRHRLYRPPVGHLVRPVCPHWHAARDYRQAQWHRRQNREPARLPEAPHHRSQPGAGDRPAGSLCGRD